MEKSQLKQILKEVKQENYQVPSGIEVFSFAKELLKHIGSTDSELRDFLVYPVLSHWILKGVFSTEEKLEITCTLLGEDYLLYGLGEEDENSVFNRAFSVLQLAVLVYLHRKGPFLPLNLLTEIKDQLFCLLDEETDLRGYCAGKRLGALSCKNTQDIHVPTALTCLMNWCYAKSLGNRSLRMSCLW